MLIKFKSPDPRAGQTVRMDSSRGQYFIDTGAAVAVKEGGAEGASNAPAPSPAPAPAVVTNNVVVNGGPTAPPPKPSEGLKVDEIKAELERRKIAIPDGVRLKDDLAALLDAAPAENA